MFHISNTWTLILLLKISRFERTLIVCNRLILIQSERFERKKKFMHLLPLLFVVSVRFDYI